MTLGRKARKAAGRKKLTYIYNAAPLFIRHLRQFNASVLSFRDKQQFSCKTATVTFSSPCPKAWRVNKGLQWVSYEPKWNVSAIQSHTLKSSTGTRPPQSCGVNSGCVTKSMPQTLPLLHRATGSKDFWVPSRSPHPVCENRTVSSPPEWSWYLATALSE